MSWQDPSPKVAIERAVKVLGGPTKTANAMGVSGARVHDWLKAGLVPKRETAIALAEATLEVGKPESAADLMSLPSVRDMKSGPNGNGKRHTRPSTRESGSYDSPAAVMPAASVARAAAAEPLAAQEPDALAA